jgi:hypothetical protein
MSDFGQVGDASLWKSSPLFSTGPKEAELMVMELRMNLLAVAARSVRRRLSVPAGQREGGVGPGLSTAFAERLGRSSPGTRVLIHSAVSRAGQGDIA